MRRMGSSPLASAKKISPVSASRGSTSALAARGAPSFPVTELARGRERIQRRLHPRFHRLRLGVFRRLNTERNRPANRSGVDAKECDRARNVTRLNHQRRQAIKPLHNLRKLARRWVSVFRRARESRPRLQRQAVPMPLPVRRQIRGAENRRQNRNKLCTRFTSGGIFLIAAALEAGCEAHFHLGIDAARKIWVGMKVVDATPHLEEVERIVHELLGRNPRNKRAVVERTTA